MNSPWNTTSRRVRPPRLSLISTWRRVPGVLALAEATKVPTHVPCEGTVSVHVTGVPEDDGCPPAPPGGAGFGADDGPVTGDVETEIQQCFTPQSCLPFNALTMGGSRHVGMFPLLQELQI